MQTETKHGGVLFHSILTPKDASTRRVVHLIIALCILGAWFFAFWRMGHLDPNREAVPLGVGWVILLLLTVPLFVHMFTGIFTTKAAEAAVFQHGIMHSCKSKVTDLAFDEITSIRDFSESTTWIVGLIFPFLTQSSRVITIFKKDGTEAEISKSQARYFHEFADTLNTAFTARLLEGITKDTLGQANITFGPQLEMVNGQLEYKPDEDDTVQMRDGKVKFVQGETGKRIFPLDAVVSMKADNDGRYISLMGENANGKPDVLGSFKTEEVQNLLALQTLLEMVRPGEANEAPPS